MRSLIGLTLLCGCAALLPTAAASPPGRAAPPRPALAASHPLLGIWVLHLPEFGCAETYHFRGDGTTLVKSAQEISESEFTVSAAPSTKGFYRLDDHIVKDNGKQDCSGEVMKPGTRATNYLRFHPSGKRFILCQKETMDTCIGPFERVPGEGV